MTDTTPPLFDKLRYLDRLVQAGIAKDQAHAHADAMEDALRQSVVTKSDLRFEMQTLRSEIAAMEHRLTIRGGLMSAAVVAILAGLKVFG